MKKLLPFVWIFISASTYAQHNVSPNQVDYELGKGLTFDFDNQNYRFRLGGFIQPRYSYSKVEEASAENQLYINRARFSLSGLAVKEKVGFMLQTDFTLSNPLLDAWISYQPTKQLRIAAGQKRSPLNNREMMINEDKFQFTDRSELSRSFTETGREFGLFLDGRYTLGAVGIAPQVALTSGDGRNSFGANSRDADKGGIKYGGRLDVYPLGYFSAGNDAYFADLSHEEAPKFVIGVAGSVNKGASHQTGEGHGSFQLFNADQREQYPDYRKIYADLLLKYRGFSFLGEYANSSVTGLQGLYTNAATTALLQPQQISTYLILGNAFNVQSGYVTKSGYSLDVRYTMLRPEFPDRTDGLLADTKAYTIGLSKYMKGNDLKIQTALSRIERQATKDVKAEVILQLVF